MCVGIGVKGPDSSVWGVERRNQADVCKPVYTRLLQKNVIVRRRGINISHTLLAYVAPRPL